MKYFTPFEWLMIDIANNYGLDKEDYSVRIQWVKDNWGNLESFIDTADDIPLYQKSLLAAKEAVEGKPSGHMMGLDASASGLQIMAALTCCHVTAANTGLIGKHRQDIYSTTTNVMQGLLGTSVEVSRKDVKLAQMTHFYGSVAEPKKVFGDKTPELQAFYAAQEKVAPGPCYLLNVFINAWQSDALFHQWQLPDGHTARIKVFKPVDKRIPVEELGGARFTHRFYENVPLEKSVSLGANIVHSIDAMVVREMIRRCNHKEFNVKQALSNVKDEIIKRGSNAKAMWDQFISCKEEHMRKWCQGVFDQWSNSQLVAIQEILELMQHKPFPVTPIHDDFRAHPNNINEMRAHYNHILAEISETHLAEDIIEQITGQKVVLVRGAPMFDKIKGAEYAIC